MTPPSPRDRLADELHATEARLHRRDAIPEVSSDPGDDADSIVAAETRELALGDRARLLAHAAALREAILRANAGTYGLCTDCGEAISQRRLQALPYALRCLACQVAHETAARASVGSGRVDETDE